MTEKEQKTAGPKTAGPKMVEVTTPEQRTAYALERIEHMSEILARQSKLVEKAFNLLVAVEFAKLRATCPGADAKEVLDAADDLILAIRETKGAGLRLQDDGWYGKDKES